MPSGDHTGNLGGGPGGDPDLRTLPPDLELLPGFHGSPEEGLCALEAVSWMTGLPHSDRPACVCPVLASFLRAMNDHMPHDLRQRLIPFLPSLVGTRDPALAAPRATALAWRAISVFAPIPLAAADLAGRRRPAGARRGAQAHLAARPRGRAHGRPGRRRRGQRHGLGRGQGQRQPLLGHQRQGLAGPLDRG
jgi:hypothetical protein